MKRLQDRRLWRRRKPRNRRLFLRKREGTAMTEPSSIQHTEFRLRMFDLLLSDACMMKKARSFLPQSPIAQFDRSVCTGEEADEARTDRDDPRRIDIGHNSNVDERSLQHSTADCAGKP